MMKNLFHFVLTTVKKVFLWMTYAQPILSNAKTNTYMSCPLKYRYQYVDRVGGKKESPHLSYNNSVHKALSEFVRRFNPELAAVEHLLEVYEKNWIREGFASEEEEKEFKARGTTVLRNYFKVLKAKNPKTILLDKTLQGMVDGNAFTAKADRVDELPDGTLVLVDYKTGRSVLVAESVAVDFQANLLWMLAQQTFPGKKLRLEYHYLEDGSTPAYQPSEGILKEVRDAVRESAAGIRNREFEPNQGPLCGWCDYYKMCPAWEENKKRFPESKDTTLFRKANEEGRMGLSYSKMGVFQNCPLSYKYIYIDKRVMRPKSFFSIGLTCHQAFEDFYRYDGPRKTPTLDFLLTRYKENWISKGYASKEQEMEVYRTGEQWMRDFYEHYIVKGEGFIPAWKVEMYFELPIGKNGSVMIGFMDRIQKNADGTYEIFDYKTDPKLRTQEEVDNDLQLTIYYWAMREALGIEVKALSLQFLKFDKCVTSVREPKDIQKIADAVDAVSADMLNKHRLLAEHYMKWLDKRGIPYKPPETVSANAIKKLTGLVRGAAMEGDADATKCLKDGDLIFPPSVNKYCGGCDFLVGCPIEHDIRTIHKDKLMHKLDDKDAVKKMAEEQEKSRVDVKTTQEVRQEPGEGAS